MKKRKKYLRRILTLLFLAIILVQGIQKTKQNKFSSDIENLILQVHFLDVGQADCTFVESEGEYMLIDAGNDDDQERVISYLKKQGVKKLDYVIGTHPHEDHIGALDEVMDEFQVDTVILPQVENKTDTYVELEEAIQENNIKVTAAKVGEVYELGRGDFKIIAPVIDYGTDYNAWSVGIKLNAGEKNFLFCGDATEEAEKDICENEFDIQAEVLKINHHGSEGSSCKEFLEEVNPDYAVISCGENNSYGHPHKETLEKLEKEQVTILRTDQQGTIGIETDGQNIAVFEE